MNRAVTTEKILEVAGEITRYLERRPNAAETVEGLAQWWLARQRFEDSKEIVHAALEHLVVIGQVSKYTTGGKAIYRKTGRLDA